MRSRRTRLRWVLGSLLGLGTVWLWWLATSPSGFSVLELLIFTGPGMVLAIATSWANHTFGRESWEWRDALVAGLIGAAVLPPILAFNIALLAALNSGAVVVTFVLGAWLALGIGLLVGSIRSLRWDRHRKPPEAPVHLELLRPPAARRARRSLVRAASPERWRELRQKRPRPDTREHRPA